MKHIFTLILSALGSVLLLHAQLVDCSGGRYASEIFSGYTKTEVTYGSAVNYQNQTQSLEMDIYQPTGDNGTSRAVVVLAHGGSFISLAKDQDSSIVKLARHLAKCGYVVASIEYRTNSAINVVLAPNKKEFFLNLIYDALGDMKAAVRYLRKTVAVDGNPYKINPNMIIVGGNASGGIMGIHLVFLDKLNEIPPEIDTTGQNGLEGISGNPGYPSHANAIISYGGCVGDTNWIEPGDNTPMVLAHATNDQTVPYGSDTARPSGFAIMLVHGSLSVRERAENLGIYAGLHAFLGAPYSCYANTATEAWNATKAAYYDTLEAHITAQTHNILCVFGVGVEESQVLNFNVYPNPSTGGFYVELPKATGKVNISLVDIMGRTVYSSLQQEVTDGRLWLNAESIVPGMYVVRMQSDSGSGTKTLMIE